MRRSDGRIITTHVGSLPRPKGLMELYSQDASDAVLLPQLTRAVREVVKMQADIGIDVVNDGEYGKAMRRSADIGAWWTYVYDRVAGFEIKQEQFAKGRGAWTFGSKERKEFAEFYADQQGVGSSGQSGSSAYRLFGLVCTGPVRYTGHALMQRDIDNLRAALKGRPGAEAFMAAVSPATQPGEFARISRQMAQGLRVFRAAAAWAELPILRWAVVENGLRDTCRKTRRRMKRAMKSREAADYHHWRVALKALYYQLGWLEPIWPKRVCKLLEKIGRLENTVAAGG
jgi:hypothetical protein